MLSKHEIRAGERACVVEGLAVNNAAIDDRRAVQTLEACDRLPPTLMDAQKLDENRLGKLAGVKPLVWVCHIAPY